MADHIPPLGRMAAVAVTLAVAVTSGLVGIAAASSLSPWKVAYLEGLEHERRGEWRPALAAFDRARDLQPTAQAAVPFGERGTLDYDPYLHLARCGVELGRSPLITRRLLERSHRAGVTPKEEIDRLAERARQQLTQRTPLLARRPPPHQADATHAPAAPTPAPATVRLGSHPPASVLAVDGHAYPPATREVELAAGRYRITTSLDGTVLYDETVDLGPGEVLTVAVPERVPTTPPATVDRAGAPASPAAADTGRVPARATRWWLAALAVMLCAALWLVLRPRRGGPRIEVDPTRRLASPAAGTLAGYTLGGYRFEHRLGSGGMATTYLGRRLRDDKVVALKVPHEHCLSDEAFRTRFVREGELGTQLHHPNIVRILEAGEDQDRPFIAMELVEGRTLRELIGATGEMPLERALDITRQAAEALDYAHSKGVVHRDLKPENLMLRADGTVLVMDFGLARTTDAPGLTATSIFVGTPAYAAPEAIAKGQADHRQDLYALGVVLFEMLQGSAPFADSAPLEQLRLHLDGRFPRREELSRPLADPVWALVRGLVEPDPAARLASAELVLVELRDLIRQLEEGTLEERPSRW